MSLEALQELWRERFDRPGPAKILCVGLNYRDHAAELGVDLPEEPLFFAKTVNTICGAGDPVMLPRESGHLDGEAELVVVLGRQARRVSPRDALEFIAGYTCGNDVSARDIQFKDEQWFRGKSFDTFCPLLPRIVPVSQLREADDLRIIQRVNGEPLQDSRTSALVFGVRELVARASDFLTLEPGDIILTGTPGGVGIFRKPPVSLKAGDEVEVEIEGIGILRNPVLSENE